VFFSIIWLTTGRRTVLVDLTINLLKKLSTLSKRRTAPTQIKLLAWKHPLVLV